MDKLELFLMFLKSMDSNLQLTVEVGGNELCFYVFMNYVFRFKVNFKRIIQFKLDFTLNQPIPIYIYKQILVTIYPVLRIQKELL